MGGPVCGQEIETADVTVIQWKVNTNKYNTRPINSIFHGSSEALRCLVLNLCLHPVLAVPMSKGYYSRIGVSYSRASRALNILKEGGWVELALNYGTVIHRARVWKRTSKFERTFRMKVGKRLLVRQEALVATDAKQRGLPIKSIPAMETYASLIQRVKLSTSDGNQVFENIILNRIDGKRLYASGVYNYQNMPKADRKKLLIGGEPTVELDFPAMHANLLLNREGSSCHKKLYEAILGELRLKVTPERRDAIKFLTNASFNVKNARAFAAMARRRTEDMKSLGVKPSEIRAAIIKAHPALSPYVCTGLHWDILQETESNIMIEVLEGLAKRGVVALPLHDSVIVVVRNAKLAKRVMEDSYKKQTGFIIAVG